MIHMGLLLKLPRNWVLLTFRFHKNSKKWFSIICKSFWPNEVSASNDLSDWLQIMFLRDLREFYGFPIEKYPIWSLFLSMSINASEYQLRFIACLSAYFYQFWLSSMYCMLFDHLSSLTCVEHGFKPTYNVVDKVGVFTFFEGNFFFKSCRKPLLTALWNLRVKSTQHLGHFKWCPIPCTSSYYYFSWTFPTYFQLWEIANSSRSYILELMNTFTTPVKLLI